MISVFQNVSHLRSGGRWLVLIILLAFPSIRANAVPSFVEGLAAHRLETDETFPVVDGELDEKEWSKAVALSNFGTLTEGNPKMGKTEIKVI